MLKGWQVLVGRCGFSNLLGGKALPRRSLLGFF